MDDAMWNSCRHWDDAFDVVIASLTARAGHIQGPPDLHGVAPVVAEREGWIIVPTGELDDLPQGVQALDRVRNRPDPGVGMELHIRCWLMALVLAVIRTSNKQSTGTLPHLGTSRFSNCSSLRCSTEPRTRDCPAGSARRQPPGTRGCSQRCS